MGPPLSAHRAHGVPPPTKGTHGVLWALLSSHGRETAYYLGQGRTRVPRPLLAQLPVTSEWCPRHHACLWEQWSVPPPAPRPHPTHTLCEPLISAQGSRVLAASPLWERSRQRLTMREQVYVKARPCRQSSPGWYRGPDGRGRLPSLSAGL